MASRKNTNPTIKKVIALSGDQAGNPVSRISGGTILAVEGNFKTDKPRQVSFYFDKINVSPLPLQFSSKLALVQAPFPKGETKTLKVRVGKEDSSAKKLSVHSTIDPELPGSETVKLYALMDSYSFMLGQLARALPVSKSRRTLMDVVVDYMNGARTGARQSLDMLMQWQTLQSGMEYAQIRTIEFLDSYITESNLQNSIVSMTGMIFGPLGLLKELADRTDRYLIDVYRDLYNGAEELFDDIVIEVTPFFKEASDYIEEHTKLFDGIENGLKVATPSISAGVGAGGEAGVDVSFNSGEAFSAVVRGIDGIGQILGQESAENSSDRTIREIHESVAKLESKADIQGSSISVIINSVQRQEEKGDRITEKVNEIITAVNKLEEKADRQETQIGILEQKGDIIETKIDRIEEKSDRQEGKLDILESKADRQESKIDRLEEKADRQEEKLDKLEGKADRQEKKSDRLEQKMDRQEQKLDKQETKLDRIEKKMDRQESKLDKLEKKSDKQETKLDKLEKKADRQEGKLDKLEGKADKQEHKLDKIEAKSDRLKTITPSTDSALASQQGTSSNVTAAIATIKSTNGRIYIRFAVNVRRDQLNEPGVYTNWKNFGLPAGVLVAVDVSIDLQYQENSDTVISGLLIARDATGKIYQRTYEEQDHQGLPQASNWTPWSDFPGQP